MVKSHCNWHRLAGGGFGRYEEANRSWAWQKRAGQAGPRRVFGLHGYFQHSRTGQEKCGFVFSASLIALVPRAILKLASSVQTSHNTSALMRPGLRLLLWIAIALLGALAVATIALHRGEQINALWLVTAAVCTYAVGYRFYSKFIAAKVLALDAQRATPAERLENGRDFVPTNKWVVFGHHFAAIAGPGPLVGPVLAAQFGYLPGTFWILVGAVFGACVQDFVILVFSVRRDGKSLTEMAKDEIGRVGGLVAYGSVISILVILLAVCALIVVNALKQSPWGTFTIAMTIPIALLMGVYLRRLRPGGGLERSPIGVLLVLAPLWGGRGASQKPPVANNFTLIPPPPPPTLLPLRFPAF